MPLPVTLLASPLLFHSSYIQGPNLPTAQRPTAGPSGSRVQPQGTQGAQGQVAAGAAKTAGGAGGAGGVPQGLAVAGAEGVAGPGFFSAAGTGEMKGRQGLHFLSTKCRQLTADGLLSTNSRQSKTANCQSQA